MGQTGLLSLTCLSINGSYVDKCHLWLIFEVHYFLRYRCIYSAASKYQDLAEKYSGRREMC